MKVRKFDSQHAAFWMAAKNAIRNIEETGRIIHMGAYSLILVATDGDPIDGEDDYVNYELSTCSMGGNDPDREKLAEILALSLCRGERNQRFGKKVFLRYIENVDLDTLRDIQKRIENRLNMEAAV
jgi:hypothetical protein